MFASIFRFSRRVEPIMLVLMAVLLATGLMFIYGTGLQIGGHFAGYWRRQTLWLVCGLLVFTTTAAVDYRRLANLSWLLYLAAIGALVSLFFIGTTINASRRWLIFGPLSLQPAEFAKPATILFLAWLASRTAIRLDRWLDVAILGLAAGGPAFLIAQQPDYGTALVFMPTVLAIAFVGGLPWRYILVAVLLVAAMAPLSYRYVLRDYQRSRIDIFFRPSQDITGAGYNADQSLLTVGSGGWMGKGFMAGHQYKLGYLPRNVASTDFIFSVIGEETGFVGGLTLIAAMLGLIGCCLRTAALACDRLGGMICVGVGAMLFVHVYINVGMTIGAAPITGLPLPLVSYGGSFMLGMMACLGLVQSVYARRNDKPQR